MRRRLRARRAENKHVTENDIIEEDIFEKKFIDLSLGIY
jgi:hypothetical protein